MTVSQPKALGTELPVVSVVVPTYNRSIYIRETLDSVLRQAFSNFEVIVVDDGSTDETETVLRPYLDQIRYIRQENGGAAAARNMGVRNARGAFIAFMDSDDLSRSEERRVGKECRL